MSKLNASYDRSDTRLKGYFDRMKSIRIHFCGDNAAAFARLLGLRNQAYYMREYMLLPSDEFLELVVDKTGVPPNWLLYGSPEDFRVDSLQRPAEVAQEESGSQWWIETVIVVAEMNTKKWVQIDYNVAGPDGAPVPTTRYFNPAVKDWTDRKIITGLGVGTLLEFVRHSARPPGYVSRTFGK